MATVPEQLPVSGVAWRRMPLRLAQASPYRASVGVIALANDISFEPELRHFFAPDVALYVNRIDFPDETNVRTLRALGDDIAAVTARILPGDPLDVVMFGCTSGTMAVGDAEVAALIRAARPEVAATDPITAGLAGLRRLGCRRIALLTPYSDEVNDMVARFVSARGVEVGAAGSFGCDSARDMCNVAPEAILEAVCDLGSGDVDGVFVSCTALRVSPVIEAMERRLGKPVVSSNQALAWHAMRLAGVEDPLPDRGSLLRVGG